MSDSNKDQPPTSLPPTPCSASPVLVEVLRAVASALSEGYEKVGVLHEVEVKDLDIGCLLSIRLAHRGITLVANGTCDDPDIGVNAFEWGLIEDGFVGNPDPLVPEYKPFSSERQSPGSAEGGER